MTMHLLTSFALLLRALLRSRGDLALENLAVRQQLAVLKAKRARRRLRTGDRLLWVLFGRLWRRWCDALIIVQPETVIRWHREGFRRYWRWKARCERGGRPLVHVEIRDLLCRLANENRTWGARRVHSKIRMFGVDVPERTVTRYMPKHLADSDAHQRWMTFLGNHRDGHAVMGFFSVPTVTFQVLYVLFIIYHGRRKILHVGVTPHPTAALICQGLREAFPDGKAPRFLIFDRDGKFGHEVLRTPRGMGIEAVRTALRSPWQNGIAERWVLSVRQDLLNNVIVLGEKHLRHMLGEYILYDHEDRCHLAFMKDSPVTRCVTTRSGPRARIITLPRVGGLHHRYEWRSAA